MKSLFLNSTDSGGGAAIAALRLMQGLRDCNVDMQMLVQYRLGNAVEVAGPETAFQKMVAWLNPFLDSAPVRFYKNRPLLNFSTGVMPSTLGEKISHFTPDIVHLHWLGQGFAGIKSLSNITCPIVWTLHDLWAFTGGCHYSEGCDGYVFSCGKCPVLGSNCNHDLSRLVLKHKTKYWKELDIALVAPSRWIADCARKSSLFGNKQIHVIPNGLNLQTYKPHDRKFAREVLGLPQGKKLILFGAQSADDPRKGLHLLLDAMPYIQEKLSDEAEFVVFGSIDNASKLCNGLRLHCVGKLHDEISLNILYSAADVFVAPSREENLSNSVMEALACGIPCVAFDIGGMPDLIDHGVNGYLAEPFAPEDFAKGILWVVSDEQQSEMLSTEARKKVENAFSMPIVAQKYLQLYEKILGFNQLK